MDQLSQNTVQQASTSKLSSLFMAFKSNAGATGSSGNLFANLLNETEASLPKIEACDPSKTQAFRKNGGQDDEQEASVRDSEASRDDEIRQDDKQRSATRRADYRDEAAGKADQKPAQKAEKKEQAEAQDSTEAAPEQNTEETTQETAAQDVDVAANCCAKTKTEEEGLDDVVDEDLAALMLALLPFEDKAPKVEEASADLNAKPTEETQETAEDQAISPSLMTVMSQLDGLGEKIAKKIEDTLEKRLSNVVKKEGEADLAGQMQDELKVAAEDAPKLDIETADEMTTVVDEDSAYAKMVDESSLSQQHKSNGGQKDTTQDFFNMMRGQSREANTHVNASAVGIANANPQSTAATAGTVSESGVQATSSSGSTQATTNLAAGARPVGSYDFASELSAARVTKGGSSGLPQAVEQVAVQLHKAVKGGANEITIQLRPAELGKIEIKLEFAADKTVTGVVTADNQATLNLLQKDASSLQRALQEAGLQADAGCMQFNLSEDNQARQFTQNQTENSSSRNRFAFGAVSEEDEALAAQAAETETYYITPGRVNLRV